MYNPRRINMPDISTPVRFYYFTLLGCIHTIVAMTLIIFASYLVFFTILNNICLFYRNSPKLC